jgi:hypothetical protein
LGAPSHLWGPGRCPGLTRAASRVTRENDNDNDPGDDEAGADDRDGGNAGPIGPVRTATAPPTDCHMLRVRRIRVLLERLSWVRLARKRAVEVDARANAEFGEHLVQVVFDSARADEQPRADLRIREAVAGKASNLRLLGG